MIGGYRAMGGKLFLEEVQRRGLISLDRDMPPATFLISDEDATCLTIDTNKMSKMFDSIGSFDSSGCLIHWLNNGTIGIESDTINKFCLIMDVIIMWMETDSWQSHTHDASTGDQEDYACVHKQ